MTKFSDLKLDPKVLKAIAEAGYENPTPIQEGAIPPALEGRDVLGIAQTGTGKTASFTLPMITLLGRGRARARMPRSLVLCPTRELAAQVAENFDIYAKHTKLTKALLIGGVSFGEQDKLIDRGVDVLIATPGRLLDHFERGKLLLTGVQIMVVDEADRMLDMGFIPDIERIFQLTPFTRQTLFFSATMAPEIERITNTFLHSPERIEVARQATTSETITQKLVEITPTRRDLAAKQKRELLRALIKAEGDGLKNAIIFCNRKTEVDIVAKSLKKHGFDAAPIHGDLDQSQRTRTLEGFRDGTLKFLIASDVAARGLDIPAVSHVFNFDLPSHAEDYVHRIGRTGRAGRQGTAISLAVPADEKYLAAIEDLVKQAIPRGALPEGFSLSDRDDRGGRGGSDREERRGRGKDRGRSGRDRDRGDRDRDQSRRAGREERADEAERNESAPIAEIREEPRRDEPRRDDRKDRDHRRDRHDRRDRGRDHVVMGMGDHVPEFMLTSFRPSIIDGGVDQEEAAAKDGADNAADTSSQESKGARSSSGSRRRRGKKDKTEADNSSPAISEEAAPQSDGAPADAAPADAAPDTAGDDTAKKPRRARRKKAEPGKAEDETVTADPATAETVEKAPAKPRAPRRKKAEPKPEAEAKPAAVEPAPVVAEGADPAEPAPKPRRARRKKAETSEN